MKEPIFLFILVLIFSCVNPKIIEIDFDKSIIPEGIAIYPKKNKLYLSSVHKNKIIEFDLKKRLAKDFTTEQLTGFKSGVGMTVKDGKLFAICGKKTDGKNQSNLMVYDLDKRTLLKTFTLRDTSNYFLNDLAIGSDETIYISDTYGHRIFKLDYPDGEIESFLEDPQIQYPNGIAISENGATLFVDSWTSGIRIIDLATKNIINKENPSTSTIGIDGLKYYQGNLYGIRNSGKDAAMHGLIKIELTPNEKEITQVTPLLLGHAKMNVPTTFCIQEEIIYIIANSQLDNLNQKTNEIIKVEALTNTFILKYKLRN